MKKIEIVGIKPNSIAEELEILPGDKLLLINGVEIFDILDYKFQMSDENIVLTIEHDNEMCEYEIEKNIDEDIGLIFKEELIDNPKRCMNKCIFCFMDQLPDNMRKTLIFKDDDYRLSFFTGNYITFTNCNDEDIDRIIQYRLSPINISVHTTNPELRCKMLNNKRAGEVLKYIQKLYDNQIYMNGQIVLCPEYNDGEELIKTVNDLSKYYPYMQSISIVPVGLTKYRENLTKLRLFTNEELIKTIQDITQLQKKFHDKFGSNLVYLSDEFYAKSNNKIPEYEEYDEFPQLENGVGMISLFEKQFYDRLNEIEKNKLKIEKRKISIVTGKLIEPYIQKYANILMEKYGIEILVYGIENNFFGTNITVTGLLTGTDILEQMKNKETGEAIYICDVMLKSDEDIFLDNMTVEELSKKLDKKIVIMYSTGYDFVNELLKI